MSMEKKNYKPFDLEKAKAGEEIITEDGRAVRIICYDSNAIDGYPIRAYVDKTIVYWYYNKDGECSAGLNRLRLHIAPKRQGYFMNVYKRDTRDDSPSYFTDGYMYYTSDEAEQRIIKNFNFVKTARIMWDE